MKIFKNFRNWIFYDGENHKLECLFMRILQIVVTISLIFVLGWFFIYVI